VGDEAGSIPGAERVGTDVVDEYPWIIVLVCRGWNAFRDFFVFFVRVSGCLLVKSWCDLRHCDCAEGVHNRTQWKVCLCSVCVVKMYVGGRERLALRSWWETLL
jgi:hypothetical protein